MTVMVFDFTECECLATFSILPVCGFGDGVGLD